MLTEQVSASKHDLTNNHNANWTTLTFVCGTNNYARYLFTESDALRYTAKLNYYIFRRTYFLTEYTCSCWEQFVRNVLFSKPTLSECLRCLFRTKILNILSRNAAAHKRWLTYSPFRSKINENKVCYKSG